MSAPARVATTANITLSGLQTIDGVTLTDGERVLVWQQSTASQNGIYEASSGNWSRAPDRASNGEIVKGQMSGHSIAQQFFIIAKTREKLQRFQKKLWKSRENIQIQ